MKTYDKFEQIANDAQFAAGILGNLETDDFALVDINCVSKTPAKDLCGRGLCFLGIVGIVQGAPRIALDEPLDDATIEALAKAFVSYIVEKIKAAPWLCRPEKLVN